MFIPGANTIAGGAAIGGLSGALQPTATGESALTNTLIGGAAGGALPALLRGKKVLSAAGAPFTEQGRQKIVGNILNKAAGLKGTDLAGYIQSLGRNQELVRGSPRTLAQMGDIAGISALERGAQQVPTMSTPLTNRYVQQNLARLGVLQDIAGDPAAIESMKIARGAAVDDLYRAADDAVLPITSDLRSLLSRPALSSATSAAKSVSENLGERAISGGTGARLPVYDPSGALVSAGSQGTEQTITGKALGDIYKAARDMASANPMTGAEKAAQRGIKAATADFSDWLSNNLPAYKEANALFADLSKPINQRMIGQELLKRVEPALSRGTGVTVNRNTLAKAVIDNGDDIARQVTGMKNAKLRDIMTDDQYRSIMNVIDDFAVADRAMKSGRGAGSNTFQNMAAANLMESAGIPAWAGKAASILPMVKPAAAAAADVLGRALYGSKDELLQQSLLDALLNPQSAKAAMQAALPAARSSIPIPLMSNRVSAPRVTDLMQLLTMGSANSLQ
jgi:hypothetical protein